MTEVVITAETNLDTVVHWKRRSRFRVEGHVSKDRGGIHLCRLAYCRESDEQWITIGEDAETPIIEAYRTPLLAAVRARWQLDLEQIHAAVMGPRPEPGPPRITRENVGKVADGLGLGIDAGIREVVMRFNDLGMWTDASCEGHSNWGEPFPWVDFTSWGKYAKSMLEVFYANNPQTAVRLIVHDYASWDRLMAVGGTAEEGRQEMLRFLTWLETMWRTAACTAHTPKKNTAK